MKVKSPVKEGRVAESLFNYIHRKVDSLDDYKWKGKTYAYKKLNVENSPYVIRGIVRWEVDRTKTRKDKIDLTFGIELSIQNMLLPIWNITFEDIEGINGIDSAFEQINDEVEEFRESLEF